MFVNYSMYKLLPILLFAYGLALTIDDIYDNSYALIIGIDKYENTPLDYAVKDAESVANLLKENFNFSSKNIKTLLNEEATLSNIKNSLSEIAYSAKENDRVLIYFAGHGITDDLPDGGEMGYLLPIDGKPDKLFATSIPMDDLKRISSMSASKHMLFLIDACYGGLAATGARGIDSKTPNYIDKITRDKSRQIITAGGRGEQVVEKSEWGHSAFTLNLIRALEDGKADLNDDGYITAEELGVFLKDKVTIDSGNQQTPVSRRFTSQEGEFVFIANKIDVQITNQKTELVPDNIQNVGEVNYDELARRLKVDKLLSDSTVHHLNKSKYLLNVNPIGFIIGGNSSIGYEKYTINNWTLNYRLNYYKYQTGNFSKIINDSDNSYDITGVGIGLTSSKYFTPSIPFNYDGLNVSIGFDLLYNNVESTYTVIYQNPYIELLETKNYNSILLGLSISAGSSITLFKTINIKPSFGMQFQYEIGQGEQEEVSGVIALPSITFSYML